MKKRFLSLSGLFFAILVGGAFATYYYVQSLSEHEKSESFVSFIDKEDPVEQFLEDRKKNQDKIQQTNPFDKEGKAKILLVGLDKRLGQTDGHCDVIQFITIDSKKQEIQITAVPRGTYSPLPPGKGSTSSDYYVSNACGLGGLEYGVKQIEKIVGEKADYLVVVGFSETMGLLRLLDLPTIDTLQWLRRRQVYAIGEPQRAHNHSTFLKTLLTQYLPEENSHLDRALHYIAYKIVQTDLHFDQVEAIFEEVKKMDLQKNTTRVVLSMKPGYPVKDIVYDPEHLDLQQGVDTVESIQKKLLETLDQKKNNKEFVVWAFENDVWLQIDDDETRERIRYEFLEKYVNTLEDAVKKKEIIADYILEMQQLEKISWMEKGKEFLKREIGELSL